MWTSARTPRSIAPRWAPRSFAAGRRSSISSRSATTSRSASTRSSWLRSGSPARAGLVAASWPRDRSASRTTSRSATGRCWAPRRVLPRIFPREKGGWVRRPFRWARPSASSPRRSICPTWPVVFAPRSAGSSGWRPASGSRPPRRAHREWSMTRPDSVHPTAVVDPKATLGPGVQIGAFSVVGPDVSHVAHDCRIGDGVILINYAGITGHCEIGERATIGGLTGLVPFTRIGAYAYVGGVSKVTADVPPYVIADGNPAAAHGINVVGLRRAGMVAAERRLLQDAYRLLYRSGLSPQRAVERIRQELPAAAPVAQLLDFVAGSRRGICGPSQRDRSLSGGEEDAVPTPEASL